MKKNILTALAAIALVFGGAINVFAEEPCNNSQCQAKEGFETIGEGVKNAAEGSYNTVKEGTTGAYEKTSNAVSEGYEKVKEGTEKTYNKTKEGVVNLFNETKEKIHNATE